MFGYGMTGRSEIAFHFLSKAAERGDSRAMHNIGLMLLRGEGTGQDTERGLDWLQRSFANGSVESALALGNLERRAGRTDRAAAYYSFAAQSGDIRAMHALANLMVAGQGVRRSFVDAYLWYVRAARKGLAVAEHARDALYPELSLSERSEVNTRLRNE